MSVTIVVNFEAAEGNAAKLLPLLQQGRDFSRKEHVVKNVVASGHLAKIKALLVGPPDNGVVVAV